MILAHVKKTTHKEYFLVRFSEPDETFQKEVYVPVQGWAEVQRRMYFRNRKYIIDTLVSWLNQREHAIKDKTSLEMLQEIRFNLTNINANSFYNLCRFVIRKTPQIQEIAPKEGTKFHPFYKLKIIPILAFCAGKEIGED
jgi:hypothetical protein